MPLEILPLRKEGIFHSRRVQDFHMVTSKLCVMTVSAAAPRCADIVLFVSRQIEMSTFLGEGGNARLSVTSNFSSQSRDSSLKIKFRKIHKIRLIYATM